MENLRSSFIALALAALLGGIPAYADAATIVSQQGSSAMAANAIPKATDANGTQGASDCTDNGIVSCSVNIDAQGNAFVSEVANDGTTGTTVNKLAKIVAGKAILTATTDTTTGAGIWGIVIGGAGITGNAQIAVSGQAPGIFDGAITQGDYVQNSTTAGGSLHDAGSTRPTTGGRIIGRILAATNATPGSTPQAVLIFPPGTDAVASGGGGSGGVTWGGAIGSVSAVETSFYLPSGGGSGRQPSVGLSTEIPIPVAITSQTLYCNATTAPSAGTIVCNIFDETVSSVTPIVTCTITNPATGCNGTGTATVSAGDMIALAIATNGATATGSMNYGFHGQ